MEEGDRNRTGEGANTMMELISYEIAAMKEAAAEKIKLFGAQNRI